MLTKLLDNLGPQPEIECRDQEDESKAEGHGQPTQVREELTVARPIKEQGRKGDGDPLQGPYDPDQWRSDQPQPPGIELYQVVEKPL
jgi:hypothetical protein